jgi:hypothetical protein
MAESAEQLVVEMDLRLGSPGAPLTDDEITDLIEMIVETLDACRWSRRWGTCHAGDDIAMTIGVVVDDAGQFEALRHGATIISTALQAVMALEGARLVMPRDDPLRSSVRVLQPA